MEVATIYTSRIAINMPRHIAPKPIQTPEVTAFGWSGKGGSDDVGLGRILETEDQAAQFDRYNKHGRSRPTRTPVKRSTPPKRAANAARTVPITTSCLRTYSGTAVATDSNIGDFDTDVPPSAGHRTACLLTRNHVHEGGASGVGRWPESL